MAMSSGRSWRERRAGLAATRSGARSPRAPLRVAAKRTFAANAADPRAHRQIGGKGRSFPAARLIPLLPFRMNAPQRLAARLPHQLVVTDRVPLVVHPP